MTYGNLKEAVEEILISSTGTQVYYENAPDSAEYPYVVYSFKRDDTTDLYRDDVRLEVDVWDRSVNYISVENTGDVIDELLNGLNWPTDKVLPTFFREVRYSLDDPDKSLKRHHMEYTVQTYERKERVTLFEGIMTIRDEEDPQGAVYAFAPGDDLSGYGKSWDVRVLDKGSQNAEWISLTWHEDMSAYGEEGADLTYTVKLNSGRYLILEAVHVRMEPGSYRVAVYDYC